MNSVVKVFRENSSALFAVNGPPGTGKTTLLRDLIASVIVGRAQALTKLERPELAFAGAPDHWKTGDYTRSIFPWREEFLGFEIVVASSNNRAVENVTLEIPAKGAIDESYLPDIDYFADVATRLLAGRKQKDGEKASEAWALVAARLGNMQNRRGFVNRFWFEDKKSPVPRSRADKGFQRYLQSVKAKRTAWKEAVVSFEAAIKRETTIREGRIAAYEAMEKSTALGEELTAIRVDLRQATESAFTGREEVMSAERVENERSISLDDRRAARRNHRDFKPGLVDALFSRGAAYREWREKDQLLAASIDAEERELAQARERRASSQQELCEVEKKVAKLMAQVTDQESLLSQQNDLITDLRESLGPALPKRERWNENSDERELSSPWMDEAWNEARTQVVIEALHLHRAFIECVPEKTRKNLHGAMDILRGKVPPEVSGKQCSRLGQPCSL